MQEFWATRMLFEHHLDSPVDPDTVDGFLGADDAEVAAFAAAGKAPTPAAELAALKNVTGGIALAYRLMTASLQQHVHILYAVTQEIWSWYVDQVKHVKSPSAGIRYLAKLADGGWAKEPHLSAMLGRALESSETFELIGLGVGVPSSAVAHKVLLLTWHLLGHRAWSLSRHSVAPDCFVKALSGQDAVAADAVGAMRSVWGKVVQLEQCRGDVPAAAQLWNDLDVVHSSAIRCMFVFYEGDQWRANSRAGRKLLMGLLKVLPDNKIVEDLHGDVRKDHRSKPNQKATVSRIQHVLLCSKV